MDPALGVIFTEFAFSTSLSGKIQESSSLVRGRPRKLKMIDGFEPKMSKGCVFVPQFSAILFGSFQKKMVKCSTWWFGWWNNTLARTFLAESGDVNQKSWLEFWRHVPERLFFPKIPLVRHKWTACQGEESDLLVPMLVWKRHCSFWYMKPFDMLLLLESLRGGCKPYINPTQAIAWFCELIITSLLSKFRTMWMCI